MTVTHLIKHARLQNIKLLHYLKYTAFQVSSSSLDSIHTTD